MRIDKKKASTLFALTLLIVALVAINLNVPTGVAVPEEPIYLHGPSLQPIHMNSNITLTPVHMHYTEGLLEPYQYENPKCTWWHELYPNYCADWHLTSWNDTGEPYFELSPNDQIDMTDEDGNVTWYHVDRITYTLNLSSYPEPFERIFIEFKGPPLADDPINYPVCTYWHEVYPSYSNVYHIIGASGPLEYCTLIDLNMTKGPTPGDITTWHVDDVATDLILREKIIDPICTWWHAIYPEDEYCNWYHLSSWEDGQIEPGESGYGMLSPCDQIDMTNSSLNWEEMWDVFWSMGDVNEDGYIDDTDLYLIEIHLGTTDPQYDITKDGIVDDVDWTICTGNRGLDIWTHFDIKWYHVDRVTVTLNVTIEDVQGQTKWMKIELKTLEFEEIYEVFKHPLDSLWHEVYPNYCNVYALIEWDWMLDDNCNGVLDPCDYIWLLNITTDDPLAEPERWHIEDMTYDLILNKKISNPVCTDWHALYPPDEYCNWYHIEGWNDTQPEGDPGHGLLSPCDNITMNQEEYHVENVTITLNVSSWDYPGEFMFIESMAPFEEMYLPKTEPWAFDWHEVWPIFCTYYYIEEGGWEDNCNGVLDYCDNVTLFDPVGFPTKWHVEEVAVDMVVKKTPELVHDVAVINVFSLLPWVYQGAIDPINVTVTNPGDFSELTVDVYAFYGGNLAAPKQTTSLNIGETKTLTFNWDTTGVPPGFYTVSANATIPIDDVPGNNYLQGNVQEVKERPPPPPMYWKANYPDYAPSGVPDFNQRQDLFNPGNWTWCVPTAVANSLWWTDSRFETSTTPPPTINNTFNLVSNYTPGIDDHDPQNVQPFIKHLAYLMDTDGQRTGISHAGTLVSDTQTGIAHYLSWTGLNPLGDVNGDGTTNQTDYNIALAANNTQPGAGSWNMAADIWPVTTGWPTSGTADNVVNQTDLDLINAHMDETGMFYEKTVRTPDFQFVEDEVIRCEDVILLLDFYNPDLDWTKTTDPLKELGHAVTVAGVNSTSQPPRIAISDPDEDNAEPPPQGTSGPGRVLPQGVTHVHNATPPHTLHNNASYVSHDIYNVTFTANIMPPPLPHVTNASWALANYPAPPGTVAVVEWAVVVSPLPVEEEVCGVNITNVVPSFKGQVVNAAYHTWTIQINVTVHNNGTTTTNCTVNAYCYNATNTYLIGTQNVTNLPNCTTTTLTFNFNLTLAGLPENTTYTIKANATCPCTASDEFINGQVKVRVWGDVDGTDAVDIGDVKKVKLAYSLVIITPFADIDGDCTVDIGDVKKIKLIYSGKL